jgi:hypothetical protein
MCFICRLLEHPEATACIRQFYAADDTYHHSELNEYSETCTNTFNQICVTMLHILLCRPPARLE